MPDWGPNLLTSEYGGHLPPGHWGLTHGPAQEVPLGQMADRATQSLWSVPVAEPVWRVQPDPQAEAAGAVGLGLTFSTLMLAFALVSMNLIP